MLIMGVSIPMLVSYELAQALAAIDFDMPLVLVLAVRFGMCMKCSVGITTWAVVIGLTSLPAWFVRDARLDRLYVVGGLAALLLMFVMAGALQLGVGHVLDALNEQPAAPAAQSQPR